MAEGATRLALTGYSGVALTLIGGPEGAYVRKQARRAEQNDRLRAQAAKLARAHAAGLPCPACRADGVEDGLFWFDMDYVPGESLANGLVSGRAIDWAQVAGQVAAVVARFRAAAGAAIDPAAFSGKLAEIGVSCAALDGLAPCRPRIGLALDALGALDWAGIPDGPCHGDLTLENMLLRTDGSLMLIDFDVPAPESFTLDIGKIYQDLSGEWFLRHLGVRDPDGLELLNAKLNLARARNAFDAVLRPMLPDVDRIPQFAAFHMARTLPYTRDPVVAGYVLGRIESLLAHV